MKREAEMRHRQKAPRQCLAELSFFGKMKDTFALVFPFVLVKLNVSVAKEFVY